MPVGVPPSYNARIARCVPLPVIGRVASIAEFICVALVTITHWQTTGVGAVAVARAGAGQALHVDQTGISLFMKALNAIATNGSALVVGAFAVQTYAGGIARTRVDRPACVVAIILVASVAGTQRYTRTVVVALGFVILRTGIRIAGVVGAGIARYIPVPAIGRVARVAKIAGITLVTTTHRHSAGVDAVAVARTCAE